ncbi:MAG TPA: type II secretion system F family protein [Polyangia bacterium]|jgi:tight adherence protein C|nr:type II secretion system F family protein [Polyangia bacterium]
MLDTLLANPAIVIGTAAIAGMICVIAFVGGVRSMLSGRNEVVDRLGRVGRSQELDTFEGTGSYSQPVRAPREDFAKRLATLLKPFSALAKPTKSDELSRARLRMIQAGLRGENSFEIFMGLKLFLAPLLTIGFLELNANLANPMQFPVDVVLAIWICGFVFFVPNMWLNSKIKERQQALERALPDAMDLLVTCVEAGLGLDAAMSRVSQELVLSAPILGEELNQTFLEVQAGVSRADSFRRLAERTGVEDLRSLSAMLIQTDLFGTSIARALRIHSDHMRVKRMQQAEEKAAMVSVKMTVPLVLFILPSLIAVVMGPAIVMIAQSFGGTGQ